MAYFDDAKALVDHAANELPKLQKAYDGALHEQSVKSALLIEIKNIMENLRSALDFAAHGLFDSYGSSSRSHPNIYFPYASSTKHRPTSKRRIELKPVYRASLPHVPTLWQNWIHTSTTQTLTIGGCLCSWI